MINRKNKHIYGQQIGLEPRPLDIDMSDREKTHRTTRRWLAAAALALSLGVGFLVSRGTETAPQPESEVENTFSGIAKFDEHGEGGIGVFVDTVMELRPDLVIYETDELTGEPKINRDETRNNIENELGVNAIHEGQQLSKAIEGVPQVGAEVDVRYQDGSFSYEQHIEK